MRVRDRAVSDFVRVVGGSRVECKPEIDWRNVESVFGVKLPWEYKRIVDLYGPLVVNAIRIDSPRWWPEGGEGWCREARETAFVYEDNRREFPDEYEDTVECSPLLKSRGGVLPFRPEHPGLLKWGDDGGAFIYWLTEGDPDEWPIVVDYRDEYWELHEMSTAEFLVKAVEGRLDTSLLRGSQVVRSPVEVTEFADKRRLVE